MTLISEDIESPLPLLTIQDPIHGRFFTYRPDLEEVTKTANTAKAMFFRSYFP